MKPILTIIGVAVLGGAAIVGLNTFGSTTTVTNDTATSTAPVVEEVVVEVDVLDAARQELERVNNELNVEEEELLKQKAEMRASYEADVAVLDARLEEITAIRSSF